MVDYTGPNNPLSDRSRAYLNMNCAYCHNPFGWEKAADLDFSYELEFNASGIEDEANR